MAKSKGLVVFLLLGIISSLGTGGVVKQVEAALSPNFYNLTCPLVEQVVRSTMAAHFQQDPSIAAHILRLQFHDCAATGCDASLLITGPDSEQLADPNLTLLGFGIINEIKEELELLCPATVSCADILAMSARDSVSLTGGPNYTVALGRFDSTFSGGINVDLPSADDPVPQTIDFFQNIGLSATDLVVLLGGHTIGVAHCSSIEDRLYNFQGTGVADPSFNQTFLTQLETTCPQGNPNASTTVPLDDLQSENIFDNHFYSEVEQHRGVLAIDEAIFTSNVTSSTVNQMSLNSTLFFEDFVASIIRMGLIGIRDATNGTIRTNCSVVNTSSADSPAPSPATGISLSPAASPGIPDSDSPSSSLVGTPAPVAGG